MSKYKKLLHVIYKCDYHIVWVPKYRFRILKGPLALKKIKDMVEIVDAIKPVYNFKVH